MVGRKDTHHKIFTEKVDAISDHVCLMQLKFFNFIFIYSQQREEIIDLLPFAPAQPFTTLLQFI